MSHSGNDGHIWSAKRMRRTSGHTIKDDHFMYLFVKTVAAIATAINQFMVNGAALALVLSTQQWIPLACFYVESEGTRN